MTRSHRKVAQQSSSAHLCEIVSASYAWCVLGTQLLAEWEEQRKPCYSDLGMFMHYFKMLNPTARRVVTQYKYLK